MSIFDPVVPAPTVSGAQTRTRIRLWWWAIYMGVFGVTMFVGFLGSRRSAQLYFTLCLALLLLLLLSWFRFPRSALGATVFLTLLGDLFTVSWFPFTKNLSSPESIFFVANSISFSPLELAIAVGLTVVLFGNVAHTGRLVREAPLNLAMAAFSFFVLVGLVVGLSGGGDMRVALFEARPLIYLPALYFLISNVCRTTTDYRRMMYPAIAAIFLQSLLSLQFYFALDDEERAVLESLNEHGAAISMNLLLVALITAQLFPGRVARYKWLLLAVSVPVAWAYIISQRRAGFVALIAAVLVVFTVLFWHRRRTFKKVVPVMLLLSVGYLGAFWNSESPAAFPAGAVKSVVAPDQLGEKDASSDLYREIEKYNLSATVRSAPLQGIGFGQPFLRPIPLPDISSFELNAYLPHNSLLWVWTKVGFFGFVTMLYMLSRSISLGTVRLRRMGPGDTDLHVLVAGVCFIVMYTIFLYVEIAWEPRNVLLLAWALALCTSWNPAKLTASDADQSEVVLGRTELTTSATPSA